MKRVQKNANMPMCDYGLCVNWYKKIDIANEFRTIENVSLIDTHAYANSRVLRFCIGWAKCKLDDDFRKFAFETIVCEK